MKKFINIVLTLTLTSFSGAASAVLLDFNDPTDLGVTLGGSMTWNGTGGGHLYNDVTLDDDFIFFLPDSYVNSFEMNAMAWEGFNKGAVWSIDIAGFNASDEEIWSATVDLSAYLTWDNWLTVSVETANIAQLTFFATNTTGSNAFWPSIDNMVINEQVPLPASIWLFASGLIGLIGMRLPFRQRK